MAKPSLSSRRTPTRGVHGRPRQRTRCARSVVVPQPIGSRPATRPWQRPASLFALWLAAALAFSLLLYAPTLDAFFASDEIPSLASAAPQLGKTWLDCLGQLHNGFYRITMLGTTHLLTAIFGYSPLAFHLTSVLFHALACAVAGLVALRFYGRAWAGWLATLLAAAHVGGYAVGLMISNISDAHLALGLLGGLLGWDHWLVERRRGGLAVAALGFALCLVAKETCLIYPAALLLWGLARGGVQGLTRRDRAILAAFFAVALAYAAWGYHTQVSKADSYVSIGLLSPSPRNYLRQWADYLNSAFLPYLNVLAAPGDMLRLPHAVYWALRLAMLATLGTAAWRFFARGPRGRWPSCLLLLAALSLALPSLLAGPPQARYIYLPLQFTTLLLVGALVRLHGRRRAALAGVMALLWAWMIAGFYLSPTIRGYLTMAERVERFVGETRRLAPTWPTGAQIAIYDHPERTHEGFRWVYSQLLFNVFIPEARATVQLDQVTSQTSRAYRFDGQRLVELPQEPKISKLTPKNGQFN